MEVVDKCSVGPLLSQTRLELLEQKGGDEPPNSAPVDAEDPEPRSRAAFRRHALTLTTVAADERLVLDGHTGSTGAR